MASGTILAADMPHLLDPALTPSEQWKTYHVKEGGTYSEHHQSSHEAPYLQLHRQHSELPSSFQAQQALCLC
jgi:hypothetical protein